MSHIPWRSRAPLVPLALAFISGLIFQHTLRPSWFVLLAALVPLFWLLWKKNEPRWWYAALLAAVGAVGMLRMASVQVVHRDAEKILARWDGSELTLDAQVEEHSRKSFADHYVIRILPEDHTGLGGLRFLLRPEGGARLAVGSLVKVRGVLERMGQPRNPGAPDFAEYYRRQGIWGEVRTGKDGQVSQVVRAEVGTGFGNWMEGMREGVAQLFHERVGGEAGAFMTALIVGKRDELPKKIIEEFADTGVIHVLAVSGLHVAYVLVILLFFIKLLRIPFGLDKMVAVVALGFYAAFTGATPSVVRSCWMAVLFLVAPVLQRKADIWNILGATALIMLVADPQDLFDLGFQLSFAAVASIVFFYPLFQEALPDRLREKSKSSTVLRHSVTLILVTTAAQLGTLPLTWNYFGKIPLLSLFANLLIVPLSSLLVAGGFAMMLVAPVSGFLTDVFGQFNWLVSEVSFWIVENFDRIPGGMVHLAPPEPFLLAAYAFLLVAIWSALRREGSRRWLHWGLLSANCALWTWATMPLAVDILALDVGQGDAVIVRTPTLFGERSILIDTGPRTFRGDAGRTVVVPTLQHLGIHRLDGIILSHPHSDHIGGMSSVVSGLEVGEVWDTNADYHSRMYENVLTLVEGQGIHVVRPQPGTPFKEAGPLSLVALYPDSSTGLRLRNINDASLVLRLRAGNFRVLLVGDLERAGDRELVRIGKNLRADVLKVAHHGSITSTSPEFLSLVQPTIGLVSVGRKNKFGHPSPLVMKRLEEAGCKILRTDLEGAIWLKTDGDSLWVHPWRIGGKRQL